MRACLDWLAAAAPGVGPGAALLGLGHRPRGGGRPREGGCPRGRGRAGRRPWGAAACAIALVGAAAGCGSGQIGDSRDAQAWSVWQGYGHDLDGTVQ